MSNNETRQTLTCPGKAVPGDAGGRHGAPELSSGFKTPLLFSPGMAARCPCLYVCIRVYSSRTRLVTLL
ncbi:uncharacterized [Tachysurus ichikawai]